MDRKKKNSGGERSDGEHDEDELLTKLSGIMATTSFDGNKLHYACPGQYTPPSTSTTATPSSEDWLLPLSPSSSDSTSTKTNGFSFPSPNPSMTENGIRGDGEHDEPSSKLSKLSESVVAIASFDGNELHHVCTGIVIKKDKYNAFFISSSDLVTHYVKSDGERVHKKFEIKVTLPNEEIVGGVALGIDLNSRVVLGLMAFDCFVPRVARFDKHIEVCPQTYLWAIMRNYGSGSKELVKARGVVVDDMPKDDSIKGAMLCTCKTTKGWAGGPLVDMHGKILGMTICDGEMTQFLPVSRLFELFGPGGFSKIRLKSLSNVTRDGSKECCSSSEDLSNDESDLSDLDPIEPWPSDDEYNETLRSLGYPIPKFEYYRMYLLNTFEEEFGEYSFPQHAMAASKLSECVVSLASFNGTARFFACSGVFICCKGSTTSVLTSANLVRTSGHEDMIKKGLNIQVCLPTQQRVEGTLRHYNLRYNVAVVEIKVPCEHAICMGGGHGSGVVALGRGFVSGEFMATDGKLYKKKKSRFNCKELKSSTCKITKAGIGGPLVDFNGKFVGMNFYDKEETPYLPWKIIQGLLADFDSGRTVANMPKRRTATYKWPVPEVYWLCETQQPKEHPKDPIEYNDAYSLDYVWE